ncbi:Transcription termination factor Rho [Rhodotorula toruloides ATCC 204091]|nr:Transcription termination factor Rho [Rhodotorula toruloides ATCC 204091]
MLDPIRRAKDPQGARVESVPLEEMGGRGRRRDRLERDKGRRSVTAGGLSSVRRRSQGRRSEVGDAIDFQVEGEDEVEAALGEELDFEAFLRATNTLLFHSAMGPPSCQTDPLARRRPLPSSSAFLPPTIDTLSPPISPSFALSPYSTPSNAHTADEEDDSPSSFWSPEHQTARHIAHFGAGGGPSSAPSSSAPSNRVSSHLTRRPMRISYDVPEECEAWRVAQGFVDEALAAPRVALQTSLVQAQYRQSDAWKEEGSDLFARRKDAAAKRLEMVAQQLAWA